MKEFIKFQDQGVFQSGQSFKCMKFVLVDKLSVSRDKNMEDFNIFFGNWNFVSNGKLLKSLR